MQAARRVVDEVKLRAIGLTATGHRNTAITVAHGIQGSDLTVSDNAREGIVENTTCGQSSERSGGTWGVCAND